MERATLAYDSKCGPCSRFRGLVEFLDARRALRFSSLGSAERSGLLDSVNPARRYDSFHLVLPGGVVLSGAEALPSLLGLLPAGRLTRRLASADWVRDSLTFAYSILSRLHERSACARASLVSPGSRN